MARWLSLIALVIAVAITAAPPLRGADPAPADTVTAIVPLAPADALTRLFTGGPLQADWFEPGMLDAVPLQQLQAIIDQLTAEFGGFRGVTGADSRYGVELASATIPSHIMLDVDGRISGVFFEAPIARAANIDEAAAALRSGAEQFSLLVRRGDETLAAVGADQPLAVASAFKLLVLRLLAEQIAEGQHDWAEVVTLRPEWRSFGGGTVASWPDGMPVTLATLAALMISISDNSAADALIALLGRDALEAASPRNRPFLTTGDLGHLKYGGDAAMAERFRTGDEAVRRALLAELADRPPTPLSYVALPEAEWFFTAEELCALIESVADLPAVRINPGPADGLGFPTVAFKGGSEVGVLNLTTRLTDAAGRVHCIAATWNDPGPLDDAALLQRYRTLLSALASG